MAFGAMTAILVSSIVRSIPSGSLRWSFKLQMAGKGFARGVLWGGNFFLSLPVFVSNPFSVARGSNALFRVFLNKE